MNVPEYATNVALIKDGIVQNLFWGYVYDTSFLQDGESLEDAGNLSVNIGDVYKDGHFYHGEEVVRSMPEIIYEDQQTIAELIEIIYGE